MKTVTIPMFSKVFFIEKGETLEVSVDRAEVRPTSYRYHNDDPSVCINWWGPEQIDTDCFEENVEKEGSSSFMVFTTLTKAKESKELKRQLIIKYEKQKSEAEKRLLSLEA
jgi:hypothetical protein